MKKLAKLLKNQVALPGLPLTRKLETCMTGVTYTEHAATTYALLLWSYMQCEPIFCTQVPSNPANATAVGEYLKPALHHG